MKRSVCLLLVLILCCTGCGREETESGGSGMAVIRKDGDAWTAQVFAMDTYMTLKLYDGDKTAAERAASEITRLDGLLSVTDSGSEVYGLNQSAGSPCKVSEDTMTLTRRAIALGAKTGGALDITLYPVSKAWGFTTDSNRIPGEAELARLLAYVDDDAVVADTEAETLMLPEGAEMDLGAVAKGFAGDQVAEVLKDAGVTSALLNLGSSTIRTIGTKPDGSKWRIAVQDPENDEKYAGVVEIGEGAVDTSGGYQRYFVGEDGVTYCHIIDPGTGYPVDNGLLSVTIISGEAFLGDGLSTACFVMGLDKMEEYWRNTGGFEFIAITAEHEIYVSEGAAEVFSPMGDYMDAEIHLVKP